MIPRGTDTSFCFPRTQCPTQPMAESSDDENIWAECEAAAAPPPPPPPAVYVPLAATGGIHSSLSCNLGVFLGCVCVRFCVVQFPFKIAQCFRRLSQRNAAVSDVFCVWNDGCEVSV